jgi:hypothetical protein
MGKETSVLETWIDLSDKVYDSVVDILWDKPKEDTTTIVDKESDRLKEKVNPNIVLLAEKLVNSKHQRLVNFITKESHKISLTDLRFILLKMCEGPTSNPNENLGAIETIFQTTIQTPTYLSPQQKKEISTKLDVLNCCLENEKIDEFKLIHSFLKSLGKKEFFNLEGMEKLVINKDFKFIETIMEVTQGDSTYANTLNLLLNFSLIHGEKNLAKKLVSTGADPTFKNDHTALYHLEKLPKNTQKINFVISLYPEKSLKEILKLSNPQTLKKTHKLIDTHFSNLETKYGNKVELEI